MARDEMGPTRIENMTEAVMSAPSAVARMGKRFSSLVHLWVGVMIGVPAAALGLTGIWLMVTHPLPGVVNAEAMAKVASIDAVIAAARTQVPEGAVPQQYDAPLAGGPATVRFSVPKSDANPRGILRLRIDPATMTVVPNATDNEGSIGRTIHDLHGNFLMGREGRPVVGWAGVAMCLLAVTGLVLWWPKRGKWGAAFKVTGKGSTLMVLRELHGAAGIWGLIVFFIISFTGVVISFPPAGVGPGGLPASVAGGMPGMAGAPGNGPRADRTGPPGAPPAPVELKADAAVATAQAALTDHVVRSVSLPRNTGDSYRVTMGRTGDDRGVPNRIVTVDESGSQVMGTRDSAEQARNWARPIHTGYGMGWTWWILTLLSGLLPVLFAVSGIAMWLIKRRNRARIGA
jgi:uncharacterized iron-regulated membrane protein